MPSSATQSEPVSAQAGLAELQAHLQSRHFVQTWQAPFPNGRLEYWVRNIPENVIVQVFEEAGQVTAFKLFINSALCNAESLP